MPQFYPDHTPASVDGFTQGYLAAVEWLLGEEVNRDKIRGFSKAAIKGAASDCADFQEANATDLEAYYEITGRDAESAGHDFYLTRCGHGAGFWDRGAGEAGDRLADAARVYGNVDSDVYRGWISLS
jgi:hypothetical protein